MILDKRQKCTLIGLALLVRNHYLWLICAIALALRIGYIAVAGSSYQLDPGDQAAYETIALNWLNGDGFMPESSYRPPLYPAVMGLVYFIFGPHAIAMKLFQALLGTVACMMTMLLARRLFTRRLAILAGFIVAGMPVLIHFSSQLITEIVFVFLLLGVLMTLTGTDTALTMRRMAFAGILTGLCALCRPNSLLLFALFPVWLSMQGRYGVKRIFALSSIALICTTITIAPWTLRNYSVHGAFVPVSTNGGVNLWIGNNPHATGDWLNPRDYRTPHSVAEYDTDREYYAEAFSYIKNHPLKTMAHAIKKFTILWSPYPHYTDIVFFWPIALFSLIGVAASLRERRTTILVLVLIYYSAFSCLFFANQRFHVPLLYPLAVYAACGLLRCFDLLGAGFRTKEKSDYTSIPNSSLEGKIV